MKKPTAILLALLTVVAAVGCAEDTRSPYNSPDQQRSHAGKAQGELSSDVKK
jgi:hypothetical protein